MSVIEEAEREHEADAARIRAQADAAERAGKHDVAQALREAAALIGLRENIAETDDSALQVLIVTRMDNVESVLHPCAYDFPCVNEDPPTGLPQIEQRLRAAGFVKTDDNPLVRKVKQHIASTGGLPRVRLDGGGGLL